MKKADEEGWVKDSDQGRGKKREEQGEEMEYRDRRGGSKKCLWEGIMKRMD